MSERFAHCLPFGATLEGETTAFRIWAPSADRLMLDLDGAELPMAAEEGRVVCRRRRRAGRDQVQATVQDGGRHGLSGPGVPARRPATSTTRVWWWIRTAIQWQHGGWAGPPWHETVVYELHPGA